MDQDSVRNGIREKSCDRNAMKGKGNEIEVYIEADAKRRVLKMRQTWDVIRAA